MFQATFSERVTGWDVGRQNSTCSATFGSAGYELVVNSRLLPESGLYPYCVSRTHAIDRLTALPSARVEADAAFEQLPPRPNKSLGFGEMTLRCRGHGTPGPTDDSYYAGITTSGEWSLSRAEDNAFEFLTTGTRPDLGFREGQYRRLRLDCLAQPSGDVRLVFYVDGELMGTFTDSAPPSPGDVGLGASAAAKGTLSVAFRELAIYAP